MAFSLARVPHVVNAVVRLHNFCRERKVAVPKQQAGNVTLPRGLEFDKEGRVSGDFFEPVTGRLGRPLKDQAAASCTRNLIRQELQIQGLVRPAHNVARNKHRSR